MNTPDSYIEGLDYELRIALCRGDNARAVRHSAAETALGQNPTFKLRHYRNRHGRYDG